MPKVSVLIPTYNYAQYVGQAIQSVLDQTFQDFEIVICDNASTDNTEAIVRNFDDPRIRYYRYDVTVEMGNNWNRCLSLAKGEYISLLCADDMWLPHFLKKVVEILDSYPDIGLVFTNHYYFDNKIAWVRKRLTPEGSYYNFVKIVIEKNPIPISATLIRRKCFDEIGNFKPYYTADYDLWLRISQSRWGAYHIDIPLVKYRFHKNNLSLKRHLMAENTIQVLESYTFTPDIEKANKRVLGKLYMEKTLTTNIVSSPIDFFINLFKSFKYGKYTSLLYFFRTLTKSVIPKSMMSYSKKIFNKLALLCRPS